MKILILTNNDIGLYRFRKELLNKFVDEGHEVYVSLPDGKFVSDIVNIGCKYIPTEFKRRGMNPLSDLKLFTQYLRYIKKHKPDVVLTYTIKPNIYGGVACRLCKTPYIENVTGLGTAIENENFLSKVLLKMYKAALKGASQIFFQNKNNMNYFFEHAIATKGRLIPGSGVNLRENCYEEYPNTENGIDFLFVGRIMKDKGIKELLECAVSIHDKYPNVHFSLVGGYDEECYQEQIHQLQEKGVLTAYGEQADVHSFMKAHHAIILPSYHEGLSNVLLEAAACGRPVLTTTVPGCRETFEEGVSGFGCEARNAEALEAIIEKFLRLPHEAKETMGLKGREKMSREFSRDIIIDVYLSEINKLAEEK